MRYVNRYGVYISCRQRFLRLSDAEVNSVNSATTNVALAFITLRVASDTRRQSKKKVARCVITLVAAAAWSITVNIAYTTYGCGCDVVHVFKTLQR